MTLETMAKLIVFLPLFGFLFAGLAGRYIAPRVSEVVTTALLVIAAVLSWVVFVRFGLDVSGAELAASQHGDGHGTVSVAKLVVVDLARWIGLHSLQVSWAIRLDALSSVMFVVVNTVSALVHLYSIGYMHDDPHRPRFFAYLSLFTFAMLMLVTADNLVQMFFGWEGVGLASYLLIGFWFKKPSANAAAMKAFIVNRVGDFGFALGIFMLFKLVGSVDFKTIFAAAPALVDTRVVFLGLDLPALTTACLLIFMGAMGKSAQFLLHTWLPDAMEGPTPVSALIHAATMVTAGVVLVARMSPVFEYAPFALEVVTLVGATTAFFAATVGLVQNDIKRVIAYSTCSQLGYMFVALGVGAYGVAVFHLFTHAFFKALLFLGAGSVIHAMHHEQDMRHMGGLWRKIPLTYAAMLIGTLALTGFFFTAGYYSKDAVIETAFVSENRFGTYAFFMTVIAALMTSFYSWRLVFLTFHGKSRADQHTFDHAHESGLSMLIPLGVLVVGALFAGGFFKEFFIGHDQDAFWGGALYFSDRALEVMHAFHDVPKWVKFSPAVMMALGFIVAYVFYIRSPDTPTKLAKNQDLLYNFLLNKWYFDEIYTVLFVRPALWLGRVFWKLGDGKIIDGFGPDGLSRLVQRVTNGLVRLQTGYLYHYAFAMLIGLAILLTSVMASGLGKGLE